MESHMSRAYQIKLATLRTEMLFRQYGLDKPSWPDPQHHTALMTSPAFIPHQQPYHHTAPPLPTTSLPDFNYYQLQHPQRWSPHPTENHSPCAPSVPHHGISAPSYPASPVAVPYYHQYHHHHFHPHQMPSYSPEQLMHPNPNRPVPFSAPVPQQPLHSGPGPIFDDTLRAMLSAHVANVRAHRFPIAEKVEEPTTVVLVETAVDEDGPKSVETAEEKQTGVMNGRCADGRKRTTKTVEQLPVTASSGEKVTMSTTVVVQPVFPKALSPPQRPGYGTIGKKCFVRANHFLVKFVDKDLRFMYCKDLRTLLTKVDVPRVLGILKVSAATGFEAAVLSCLEYLEAAPWTEDEEEKVALLLSESQWLDLENLHQLFDKMIQSELKGEWLPDSFGKLSTLALSENQITTAMSRCVFASDDIVKKSPNDGRFYSLIELGNGLTALLPHDPQILPEPTSVDTDKDEDEDDENLSGEEDEAEQLTDAQTKKAAATRWVGMGSFLTPEEAQGLAHFLEHMLFMGSKGFPDENEYDNYLSTHGGFSNVYTETEHTCYQFEVKPANLEGALRRFSQFFVTPLEKSKAMERELLAVVSEFNRTLQSDACRLQQLQYHTSAPGHPFNRFFWGNKKSLIDAMANGVELREQIFRLYTDCYHDGLMKLVVIGGESLDILQKWGVELFGDEKRGSKNPAFIERITEASGGAVSTFVERVTNGNDREKLRVLFEFLGECLKLIVADNELGSLKQAPEGKFVEPGPGGDPIRNPKVLPTGKNIHALDPQAIPTTATVQSAMIVVDRTLGRQKVLEEMLQLMITGDWIDDNGTSRIIFASKNQTESTGNRLRDPRIGVAGYSNGVVRSDNETAPPFNYIPAFVPIWLMVENPETDAVVSWNEAGNSFIVGHFQRVLTSVGNFCICYIAVGMVIEIIVRYPIQNCAYRPGINNLLVLLIGGIAIAIPTVLSVTMTIRAHRLDQQGAITKKMTAIEQMDVLCSDKTGTLTMNKLTVDMNLIEVFTKNADDNTVVLMAARTSRTENQDAIDGTNVSMLSDPREVHFLTFYPTDKRTALPNIVGEGKMHRVSKGSPEQILNLGHNKSDIERRVHTMIDKFAERGLRSLALFNLPHDFVACFMDIQLPKTEATWEDLSHFQSRYPEINLEDEVVSDGGRIDRGLGSRTSAEAEQAGNRTAKHAKPPAQPNTARQRIILHHMSWQNHTQHTSSRLEHATSMLITDYNA